MINVFYFMMLTIDQIIFAGKTDPLESLIRAFSELGLADLNVFVESSYFVFKSCD